MSQLYWEPTMRVTQQEFRQIFSERRLERKHCYSIQPFGLRAWVWRTDWRTDGVTIACLQTLCSMVKLYSRC